MIRWLLGYPSSPSSSSSSSVYRARSRRLEPVVTNDASPQCSACVLRPPSLASLAPRYRVPCGDIQSVTSPCLSASRAISSPLSRLANRRRGGQWDCVRALLVPGSLACCGHWAVGCSLFINLGVRLSSLLNLLAPTLSLRSYTTVPTPHAALPPKFPFVFSFLHYASSFFSFSFSSLFLS